MCGWWAYILSIGEFPLFCSIMEFLSLHMHNLWMHIQLHTFLWLCMLYSNNNLQNMHTFTAVGSVFLVSLPYLTCSYLIHYLYNRHWLLKRYNQIKVLQKPELVAWGGKVWHAFHLLPCVSLGCSKLSSHSGLYARASFPQETERQVHFKKSTTRIFTLSFRFSC